MPKRASPLTALKVKALVTKGVPWRHADGAGLYLVVTGPQRAWWMLRYIRAGRSREMGLGVADPDGRVGHSLADARGHAAEMRALLRNGTDPLAERDVRKAEARAAAHPFREVAEAFIAQRSVEWRNKTHRAQWSATLETYAYPHLGNLPVADIGLEQVKQVLSPIWTTKTETASRLRGRIEAVLDYAAVHGWRDGPNPARWQGNLKLAGLPSRAKVAPVVHHAALPWQGIAEFMRQLQALSAVSARALEFLILTAARTNEVLGARWSEMNMEAGLWTIPGRRMKAGKEHRVPLSPPVLSILREIAELYGQDREGFVFPGQAVGRPLSNMSMLALVKRMRRTDVTPHGFRSTFRDWAGEATGHPNDVIELALAHTVGSKVEAAYRRGDMFQKRRALMEDWAAFCYPNSAASLPSAILSRGAVGNTGKPGPSDID